MASIYDVDPTELIEKTAQEMKNLKELMPPEWAAYAKTGVHKERPPVEKDWWYKRAAAVLRSVYKLGPIGTSKLRKKYGGRRRRGHKPQHTYKGSGKITRKVLQQLEAAGFLKKTEKGGNKGRVLTPKGKSFIDKIASQMLKGAKSAPKETDEIKEVKPKKEEMSESKASEHAQKSKVFDKPREEAKRVEKKAEDKEPAKPKEQKNG